MQLSNNADMKACSHHSTPW